jgi:hypothetical protein
VPKIPGDDVEYPSSELPVTLQHLGDGIHSRVQVVEPRLIEVDLVPKELGEIVEELHRCPIGQARRLLAFKPRQVSPAVM